MKHILKPLNEPYPEDIGEILARYPSGDGDLLSLFRVFANSRRFLLKGTSNLLDRDSPISIREREIVILRVCASRQCEYEWGVHVAVFARHAALSAEQINDTCRAVPGDCWAPRERLLLQVVDDLCQAGSVSDERLEAFQSTWNLEQQLEILALAGNYHTISFVANTARLPSESFAVGFPPSET